MKNPAWLLAGKAEGGPWCPTSSDLWVGGFKASRLCIWARDVTLTCQNRKIKVRRGSFSQLISYLMMKKGFHSVLLTSLQQHPAPVVTSTSVPDFEWLGHVTCKYHKQQNNENLKQLHIYRPSRDSRVSCGAAQLRAPLAGQASVLTHTDRQGVQAQPHLHPWIWNLQSHNVPSSPTYSPFLRMWTPVVLSPPGCPPTWLPVFPGLDGPSHFMITIASHSQKQSQRHRVLD